MKKKISTTILIAIVCFTNYAQQNSDVFYYYQGKRIVLTQITNKISVHFSHDASLEQIYEIINKDEIFLPTSLTNIENNFFRIAVLETKGSSDLQQSTIDFLKERPEVVSVAFLLQYHKTLLSLTDEFIVKLKQNTEYARLQMLAIENNCSIIKESKFVKNQYTLSASKTSYLNTIQMANFFYETGFFEISEPDFIAFNALNSDDPYFENQWGLKN
ncbi:MAG: hypothetical protein FWC41_12065, partial [Firmicutes bacterium]|nr:hypothetical protein [Bacillota bacterium]